MNTELPENRRKILSIIGRFVSDLFKDALHGILFWLTLAAVTGIGLTLYVGISLYWAPVVAIAVILCWLVLSIQT